jgi:hypothetical protein
VQPQGAATLSAQQPRTKVPYRVPVVRALLRGDEWSRTDTLTAIGVAVAIVVGVIAIVIPILRSSPSPDLKIVAPIPRSSPSGPDLKVDDVEIALANGIDASDQIPGDTAPRPAKDTGSAIDITLRNSGTAPALIVDAVFSFTRAAELYSCPGGGGAILSSAEYDVRVPTAKPVFANNPLVLRRDMRFAVDANSIDRFRISVGPNRYSSAEWPWIYEFNLTLVEDDGQKLDLGPMTILGFSQYTGVSWDPLHSATRTQLAVAQQVPCVARDAAELSQALANPGLHSPELQMMYREAERLTENPPSCLQIPIAQNPNGCPAPAGTHTFFSDRFGVTICSNTNTIEVSGNYNCLTAENIAEEYEKAKAPKVVSMTFTSGPLVLPMQCLPAGRAEVCRSTDSQELEVGFIP